MFQALDQTDKFKPPPSPCVHVRSLSEQAIEGDLVEAVQHFGQVRSVTSILFSFMLIDC